MPGRRFVTVLSLLILFGEAIFTTHCFTLQQEHLWKQDHIISKRRNSDVVLPSLSRRIAPPRMFNGDGGGGRNDASTSTDVNRQQSETTSKVFGGITGGLQLQTIQREWDKNTNPFSIAIEQLEDGNTSLPFTFETIEKGLVPKKRILRVRQMEINDLKRCVSMCLQEYGTYSTPSSSIIKTKLDDLDNFVFSFIVLLGLEQRVKRRMESDTSASLPQDHNVIILSELQQDNGDASSKDKGQGESEHIFGMAEISLQPSDPSRTSPPFVIPTGVKKIISKISSASSSKERPLNAYVSNVLITNEYRSKGYSKVLMSTCHGLARSWGYKSTFLHVDADYNAGRAAQQLYRKLGYKPVIDKTYNEKFAWMGIDSVNRGLYIVDGLPLLFLSKKL